MNNGQCKSIDDNEVPLGKFNYMSGIYLLESQPEVKIELKESKQDHNTISLRNVARSRLANDLGNLINNIESFSQHLTPSDKREFKEAFTNLIKEI